MVYVCMISKFENFEIWWNNNEEMIGLQANHKQLIRSVNKDTFTNWEKKNVAI